jgi:hypothetical protein
MSALQTIYVQERFWFPLSERKAMSQKERSGRKQSAKIKI